MRPAENDISVLVTVVLPAFNAERYIGPTLDSVLGQSYTNLEVWVVDDGSTDRTAEIAQGYAGADNRVHVLRQKNSGVAAARNRAIRESRGAYVAPIDADDLWHKSKLEKQVRLMAASPDIVGLIYTWSERIDENNEILSGYGNQLGVQGDVWLPLLLGNFIGNSSSPLIRRAVLERVSTYNQDFKERGAQGCEDWDLYLRIAEHYEFACIPEYLVRYRKTSDSMSGNSEQMLESYRTMMRAVRQRELSIPRAIERWSRGNYAWYLAGRCSFAGNHGQALRWLFSAVAADPAIVTNRRARRLLAKNLLQWASPRFVRERVSEWRRSRRDADANADAYAASKVDTQGWGIWRRIQQRRLTRAQCLQREHNLTPLTARTADNPISASGGQRC